MGFDIAGVGTLTAASGVLSLDGTVANVMKVNANGVLTRALTPYMRGQLSGKGDYYAPSGPLLVTADVNVGGCWNNATGRFTCPVAGSYMVTGGNIAQHYSGYFYIQKNGTTTHYTHWNHSPTWHYVSLSDIVVCAAGDTLNYLIGGLNSGGFYGNGGHGMYSIALMA
ncbi:MAG TPA: hypothetical protein VIZ32_22980 [Vicinamibacterales bacterium]